MHTCTLSSHFLHLGELHSNQCFAFSEMTLVFAGWFDVTVEIKLARLRCLLILIVDEQRNEIWVKLQVPVPSLNLSETA